MSISLPQRSVSVALSPTLALVMFALAVCGLVDMGLTLWVIAGPPLGKSDSFFLELAELIAGLLVVGVAAVLYPSTARVGLPFAFIVLAWHTGFQISFSDTVPTVLSALDVIVPIVFLVALAGKWYASSGSGSIARGFFVRFRVFGVFCAWGLALALARGTDPAAMLMNLKAFTIYPLLALLVPWCIRETRHLYLSVGFLLALVTQRALVGILHGRSSGITTILTNGSVASRINGNFASVNQYAFYIMSGLLLSVALIAAGRSPRVRLLLIAPVGLLSIALILTFSRGAWLGSVVGLCVLALFLHLQRLAGLLALLGLIFVVVQIAQPGASSVANVRLHASTTTDSSLGERQAFYALGEQVVIHYPFGAGWGAGFYIDASGLQTDHDPNDWPWYHNDYLQLAVQVGIPGLLAFAWMFVFIFRRAAQTARLVRGRGEFAVIVGLISALTGMLVQAFTDQFFWRTDIAPHIWIVVGLLLAAINLAPTSIASEAADTGTASHADVDPLMTRAHSPVPAQ